MTDRPKDYVDLVRTGYSKIAQIYHEHRKHLEPEFYRSLRPVLPESGTVLDVGCGTGDLATKYFADEGYAVLGVDICPEMIEIARVNVPHAQFEVGDMANLQMPPASYDIILCAFAIIHVPRNLHAKIFTDFYRLLRPGGRLVICTGVADTEQDVRKDWYGTEMYWSHYSQAESIRLLQGANLHVLWEKVLGPHDDQHAWVIATRAPPKS